MPAALPAPVARVVAGIRRAGGPPRSLGPLAPLLGSDGVRLEPVGKLADKEAIVVGVDDALEEAPVEEEPPARWIERDEEEAHDTV